MDSYVLRTFIFGSDVAPLPSGPMNLYLGLTSNTTVGVGAYYNWVPTPNGPFVAQFANVLVQTAVALPLALPIVAPLATVYPIGIDYGAQNAKVGAGSVALQLSADRQGVIPSGWTFISTFEFIPF